MREKKAATGFEPVNGGFADRSLNHLGTPPQDVLSIAISVRADTTIQVTYLSWPQIAICPVAYRLPGSQWIREQSEIKRLQSWARCDTSHAHTAGMGLERPGSMLDECCCGT